jgi:hypothetical protein
MLLPEQSITQESMQTNSSRENAAFIKKLTREFWDRGMSKRLCNRIFYGFSEQTDFWGSQGLPEAVRFSLVNAGISISLAWQ